MAHSIPTLTSLLLLLAVTSSAKDQSRWSRQISTYTSDISDWVPLPGPVEREPSTPIKRQAIAEPRILSEPFPGLARPTGFTSDIFPSRTYFNSPANRQLYLQSVPSVPTAPQNYLTEQGFGQSIRFGLQPNFPINQGFVSPQFTYDPVPQLKPRPQQIPPSPIKFETFSKTTPPQLPITNPPKAFNHPLKPLPEVPKYIDGYRTENASNFALKKKPQSLQKMKIETYDKAVRPIVQQSSPKTEREEVQLLYVPLESLNRGQFNFRSPLTTSQLINTELYNGGQQPLKQTSQEVQRPIQKPAETFSNQDYFSKYNTQVKDQVPKFSTISTPFPTLPPTSPKPKKLKPHQPPLAIFLTEEASRNNQIKVGDVLSNLKNANSIAVLDSVNPLNAPKVFIGPSSLQPPEHYVKFELPYLSNIEHTDKKLRQLPFFVAPLSYNTPQGFAKIPFPSPHVGSVVINSQIREETTQRPVTENVKPNYFAGAYRPQELATQKPTISFYSTNAPENKQQNYQSNYYSFEPQTVSTLRPINNANIVSQPKPGNYFISNAGAQYDIPHYQQQQPIQSYNTQKRIETTTTQRPTVSTTTKAPTTYPSQLLETHNPYSINQAFHFSTPLDYHPYLDDYKDPVATPGTDINPPQTPTPTPVPNPPSTSQEAQKVEELVTVNQYQQQTSPNFAQNYSPEVHYESELQGSRYPVYNTDYQTKTESAEIYSAVNSENVNNAPINNQQYSISQETQTPINETPTEEAKPTIYEVESPKFEDNTQYETGLNSEEIQTSSTTSTTTRRAPTRVRGRPRYTTTPRSDSAEYSTRTVVTRRPLRERRPLPTRTRYEPNKITTEKPTRKPVDYSAESTTKTIRTRTRGRVQFKPSESDEIYAKKPAVKDQDLAYQRDVLHQNYPVTLMERMSTVDIEAMTEPSAKSPATESYDTENAYTNEKAAISQYGSDSDSKEDIPVFPSRTTIAQTESPYTQKYTRHEDFAYTRNQNPSESYVETTEKEDDSYKQTTVFQKEETEQEYVTEPTVAVNDQGGLSYAINKEFSHEETTTEAEETKVSQEEEEEENIVQTTPSYNRVRVRPGVIKQYHQSSTESSRTKIDRRRPVTYRPAFDKRRTTMRIDEIEADLKTKQVHSRPEVQDYRHPVYKPEPTTEATSTQEATTKRGQFRRRRPTYSYSTTTESSGTVTRKSTYEVKNRFRGRRPTTEKPTEKPEVQTDATTTSTRPLYTRHSHRPRLSERYNKKPEQEETEDQDSNYSYNRPKYAEPDQWSPKISGDSFKPYNPNTILDEQKVATTERRSDRIELDIITARNEYDDVLISVTPASNRNNKKIPEIPPTLEALVEQSKVTKSDSTDTMSTFESMLEEVMKSLEEQDENEYTSNVMKHKGGEIGEIPPERIISSGDGYNGKTTPLQQETTTVEPTVETTLSSEEENQKKGGRRGFWRKVKVRPVTTESIEVAESQYYTDTVNRLGQPIKTYTYDKTRHEKPKMTATTYKPSFEFIKDIFSDNDNEDLEALPTFEISKVNTDDRKENPTTTDREIQTEKTYASPGDLDLGTGSPDPTIDDLFNTPTEPTTVKNEKTPFSFMDYLFGVTSEDDSKSTKNDTSVEISTEQVKPSTITTEASFIPDEITEESNTDEKKLPEGSETTTEAVKAESTSEPSFLSQMNVVTSMSTEVSHETEICFRGKCIKTSKDIL